MRIYFFVDARGWAFDHIAKNIKRIIADQYEVEIVYTEDFKSYKDLCLYIGRIPKEKVHMHFFWRGYLRELIKYIAANRRRLAGIADVMIANAVTTHVPDHLGSGLPDLRGEWRSTFEFVDAYFVTSKKLYEIYTKSLPFKAPWGVIHDNPVINGLEEAISEDGRDLSLVWAGNSEWGQHLGEYDYKGLNSVITPALKSLDAQGIHVERHIFDKAKRTSPSEEVHAAVRKSDIVLIASREEGTPLPLIEAMASGCAVITTDVGIADEVLPDIQRPFICDRSASSFSNAIRRLHEDRGLLKRIKAANRERYKDHFLDSQATKQKWISFFESASEEVRKDVKRKVLESVAPSFWRSRILSWYANVSMRLAANESLRNIVKRSRVLSDLYYRLYDVLSGRLSHDYFYYQGVFEGKKFAVIYSPFFSGVRNSTEYFFKDHAVAFPPQDTVSPETNHHPDMDTLIAEMEKSEVISIVYSGGPMLHANLCRLVREKLPNVRQYMAWHGSPAQWCDHVQINHFDRWVELFESGCLDGFITFKPELQDWLDSIGLPAWQINNFIPEPIETHFITNLQERYKVGLFAAAFSWYKNPYPQLSALSGLTNIELHTNISIESLPEWLLNTLNIKNVPEKMPNSAFRDYLKSLDVVMYATNTECSPLIVLESIAAGVPCIVGPAGNVYKGNEKLENWLVESSLDNPMALQRRLKKVIERRADIVELLPVFAREYNQEVDRERAELFELLSVGEKRTYD